VVQVKKVGVDHFLTGFLFMVNLVIIADIVYVKMGVFG
jgi:hypothetical protein